MSTIRGEHISLIRPALIHQPRTGKVWEPTYDERPKTICQQCGKSFHLVVTNRKPKHPHCNSCKFSMFLIECLKDF